MKTNKWTLPLLFVCLLNTANIGAQEVFRADFETYESTPYLFRYGNRGSLGEYTYKPRWIYSHQVVDNPVYSSDNTSNKVLEYTTMEAQNYGLKFRLPTPLALEQVKEIQFKLFQPATVIGRSTYDGRQPATKHDVCIKLLSEFNAINDFRQDDGILLYKSVSSFTETGVWTTFTFLFDPADYNSQINKFTEGVKGIAILPTYNATVTLNEDDLYLCYMDDLVIRSTSSTGITENHSSPQSAIYYADERLHILSELSESFSLDVFDLQGNHLHHYSSLHTINGCVTLPLDLPRHNTYIIKTCTAITTTTTKISL